MARLDRRLSQFVGDRIHDCHSWPWYRGLMSIGVLITYTIVRDIGDRSREFRRMLDRTLLAEQLELRSSLGDRSTDD